MIVSHIILNKIWNQEYLIFKTLNLLSCSLVMHAITDERPDSSLQNPSLKKQPLCTQRMQSLYSLHANEDAHKRITKTTIIFTKIWLNDEDEIRKQENLSHRILMN